MQHTPKVGEHVLHPAYRGIGTVVNQNCAAGYVFVRWPQGSALVPVSTLTYYEED